MANSNIDPAMQAAPILGGTSFDPVEFARRSAGEKNQAQRMAYAEKQKDQAAGLQKLMVDLKGWEDQAGFKEILDDQNRVLNGYMELSRKGANLTNPKTSQEILAFKAIQDAHQQIKQKVDTWNQNKGVYDLIQKGIEEDGKLPPEQQKIDHAATQTKVNEFLKTTKILDRGSKLADLVITKPQIEDVQKFINDVKTRAPKLDVTSRLDMDENGQQISRTTQIQDPKKQKEIEAFWRNQYKLAKPGIKNAVKEAFDANKGVLPDGLSEEDAFIMMADQNYQQKFIDKTVGKGGININVGGQHVNLSAPGTKGEQPLVFGKTTYPANDHYDFDSKSVFSINLQDLGVVKGIIGDQEMPVSGGNNTPCELLHYLPNEDAFVFRAKSPPIGSQIQDKETFIIPRDKVSKDFVDLPVIEDGKQKKLKDIIGDKTSKKQIPGVQWSKPYIPTK